MARYQPRIAGGEALMDGARMAALTLHGLHGQDRDWLLAQLPAHDRAVLAPLLAELAEIGISKDTARSQSRIALRRARSEGAVPATPLERLRHANVRDVVAVLDGEPSALVAVCIDADAWPWRGAFIARLAPQRRSEIADLVRERAAARQAPRLREALLMKLDARIQARASVRAKRNALAKLWTLAEARWKRT